MSSKTNTSAKKQLLNYVKRAYSNLMKEKLDNNSRTKYSKKKKSTSSKSKDLTSTYEEENYCSGALGSELLLASDSIEADRMLYKQRKQNPAVLSYLKQKLGQIIIKEQMSGSSGIKEDVLHFASDLYKQGQLSANQFINQREEYSSYGRDELSNYTQPKFEAQEFCGSKPYFDKAYFANNGSYLKELNKETEKPRRYGNKSVCNYFWKILFIMNIAVVLFAACLANNNIKDPLVEESHLNLNQSQDSLNFNNGEKLKNMDLAFQGLDQLNQDYEMKVINPSSSQSKLSLKSIFSAYHVTFAVVVQVFIWIWYSLNSSNR